ncbi:MAG: ABC transporter permease [Atribacterota bacterium]|nr:ABC transporter permease [Atribacterota bacterium]MDD4896185.1 ABC transporter permease [Atribacterota bacterium]MDD5637283.1 ABC transporter permease [Atribacterota bacterium]
MIELIKKYINNIGLPRLIITLLFIGICVTAVIIGLPVGLLASDVIRRFGMFGVLALAMVPAIQCGTGPNFALPIGIICGLLGSLMTIEFRLTSPVLGYGFISAVLISLPFAIISGWLYGILLNKIKGSEMLVATYTGFSIVSFLQIGWVTLPFTHPEMRWPIGKGLRVTVSLESTFGEVLNRLWGFNIGGIYIPTGLLLFFIGCCWLVWLFSRSKSGIEMVTVGANPKFAAATGINVDKNRIIGTILSTIIGAVGIIVYSLSFGFLQLYLAPLYMAFPAVAAVLIGGASTSKVKISHVIIGTFLFQGLLTVALPVANQMFPEGNLSEVLRMIVQNGIILYALTKMGGES